MKKGDRVLCLHGASEWMKKRNYWLECYGETVDGKSGIIINDYTALPGDDSHFAVDMGFACDVGINQQWLLVVS